MAEIRALLKIEAILKKLKNPAKEVQEEAIAEMSSLIRNISIEKIISLMQKGDEISIHTILKVLSSCLKNSDFMIRKQATEWLGKINDPRAIETLILCLQDIHWAVRKRAVISLGNLGDSKPIGPIIECLKDEEYSVRYQAAKVLGELGDERASEPLKLCLNDENLVVRNKVKESLDMLEIKKSLDTTAIEESKYVQEADSYLLALKMGDITAIDTLGDIGDPRAVWPLIKCLESKERHIREKAIIALGKIKELRAIPPLIKKLDDMDRNVRSAVIKTLGNLADERSIDPLFRLLRRGSYYSFHVNEIIDSLLKIKIDTLNRILELSKNKALNIELREKIVKKLSSIKESKVLEPIYKRLSDKNPKTRFQTVELLNNLGDSKALTPLIAFVTSEFADEKYENYEDFVYVRYLAITALEKRIRYMKEVPIHIIKNLEKIPQKDNFAIFKKYSPKINQNNIRSLLRDVRVQFQNEYLKYRREIHKELISREKVIKLGEVQFLKSNLEMLNGNDLVRYLDALAYILDNEPEKRISMAIPEIIQLILRLLSDPSPKVRILVKYIFENLDSDLVNQFIFSRLKSGKPKERAEIIKAISYLEFSTAIKFLSKSAVDYNSEIKLRTIEILHELGNENAIPFLLTLLRDKDLEVREKAIKTLDYFIT